MDTMKELQTTADIVKAVLTEFPESRNSDSYLYLKVIERQAKAMNMSIKHISLPSFLLNSAEWGFAPFETVRRTRQKIQAEFPELSASKKVEGFRAEREKDFKNYALQGVQ